MKRFISMLMVLCMSAICIVPAGAVNISTERAEDFAVKAVVNEKLNQYPLAERIADAKRGYIDEDVSEEVLAAVSFTSDEVGKNSQVLASDLTGTDEENIDFSIKNLGEVVVDGQSVGTMYSATGVQKTKSDSKELKDVNVQAYLTIVWIDNFGDDNVLVDVTGGWNDRWGYLKENRTVTYSATDLDGYGDIETKYPSQDTFEYTDINFHGFSISAVCSIDIDVSKPNQEVEMKTFRFSLSPTIFD